MIIPESCLACVALNFYANDVCLKSSKRRFTCQHHHDPLLTWAQQKIQQNLKQDYNTRHTERSQTGKENIPMQMDAISKFFIKKIKKKKKHNSNELNFWLFIEIVTFANHHIWPNATVADSIDFPGLSPYKEE